MRKKQVGSAKNMSRVNSLYKEVEHNAKQEKLLFCSVGFLKTFSKLILIYFLYFWYRYCKNNRILNLVVTFMSPRSLVLKSKPREITDSEIMAAV